MSYVPEFFRTQIDPSSRSAKAILPTIVRWLAPKSVLDVGCGAGHWLAQMQTLGVEDVLGVDGYVPEQSLVIPAGLVRIHDLAQPFNVGRRFDLVMCLEVGEHLPAESAPTLVESLVRHADAILFSAAIPYQGGNGHINEQWQSWWLELFLHHGYTAVPDTRRLLWEIDVAEPYYLQNSMLYVAPRHSLAASGAGLEPVDIVHPRTWLSRADLTQLDVRILARATSRALGATVRRRWRQHLVKGP